MLSDLLQDHNIDFIVKFPDWDPQQKSRADIPKQNRMQVLSTLGGKRRFLPGETSFPTAHLWYSTEEVIDSFKLFIDAGNDLAGSLTYRYDLVDLTRQVLSKLANQVYVDAVIAFQRKDGRAFSLYSKKFVQLIKEIEEVLASDDNFLLGTWLQSAKKVAVNPSERRQVKNNQSFSGFI